MPRRREHDRGGIAKSRPPWWGLENGHPTSARGLDMLEVDWTLPVALVSVVTFLFLMNKILFKPLSQFMEARDKGIHDDLAEATRVRQQAETALMTYEGALAAARRELAEQTAAAQRAMEAKQREIIEQARNEANQMTADAQATIVREMEEARARLADEARELARLVVAKLMDREVRR
jgi:F-type H+-transporting ATPase subunit b